MNDANGLSDAELLDRAVRGDAAAFDLLVLRHRQGVLNTAWAALGSREEAEDAAQQAFLDAFAGLSGLREPGRFRAWLMTIARRCAVRRRTRVVTWPSVSDIEEAVICPIGAPPADHGHDDLRERVRAALDELSARSRQVVTLHYLDGYACREIVLRIALSRNATPSGPQPEPPARASGKRYWAGGREEVPPEHVLWCTGFDATGGDKGFGQWWSFGLPFERLRWDQTHQDQEAVVALAEGATDADEVAAATGLNLEQVREVLGKAVEIGLVRRDGEKLILTVPVFRKEDDEVLAPVIDNIAGRLSREILEDAIAGISDLLRKLGYGHLEEQFGEWRRWLEGNVAGEALRELLNRGILPHPGDPAPMSFAMIGWVGDLRLMKWHL